MKALAIFCDVCGCFLGKATCGNVFGDEENTFFKEKKKDLCMLCSAPIEPREYVGSNGELKARFEVRKR